MENLTWIFYTLADESKHFLLAFITGSLGSFLISTIFSVFSWVWETLTHKKVNSAVGYTMLILVLLGGLALALLSHSWLDGYSLWFSTPSGPSLKIEG